MEDRGGLRYRIVTEGDFGSLDTFFTKLERADKQFDALKAKLAQGLTLGKGADAALTESIKRQEAIIAQEQRLREEIVQRGETERAQLVERGRNERAQAKQRLAEAKQLAAQKRADESAEQRAARESLRLEEQAARAQLARLRASREASRAALEAVREQQRAQRAAERERTRAERERQRAEREAAKERLIALREEAALARRTAIERENLSKGLSPDTEDSVQQRILNIGERIRQLQLEQNDLRLRSVTLSGEDLAINKAETAEVGRQIERLRIQLASERAIQKQLDDQLDRRRQILANIQRERAALSGLSGTIARVATAFLFFETIRRAVRSVRELLVLGVEFNLTIQRAETAIAGIVAQTTDLRDIQGQNVDLAREYALAQQVAVRQANLLKIAALETTATFEELLNAFQVSFAFGVGAGFDPDQIREFAVQISQAASLLGVEQAQLAEEIRSLLQGTIRLRDTRIAAALGITNQDIRTAREAGNLFEFLQSRFDRLAFATARLSTQMVGLIDRLRDLVRQAAGTAAGRLFDELQKSLVALFAILSDANGLPSSDFIATLAPIFDAVANVVRDLREELEGLSLEDLRTSVERFAPRFEEFLSITLNLVIGIGQALPALVDGFVKLVNSLESVVDLFNTTDEPAARLVGRIGVLVAAFFAAVNVTRALLAGMTSVFLFITKIVVGSERLAKGLEKVAAIAPTIAAALRGILFGPIGFFTLLAGGLAIALKEWAEHLVGFELTWKGFADFLVDTLAVAWVKIKLMARETFDAIVAQIKKVFTQDKSFGDLAKAAMPEPGFAQASIEEMEAFKASTEQAAGAVDNVSDAVKKLQEELKAAEAQRDATLARLKGQADATAASLEKVSLSVLRPFRVFASQIAGSLRDLDQISQAALDEQKDAAAEIQLIGFGFDEKDIRGSVEAFQTINRLQREAVTLSQEQAFAQNTLNGILRNMPANVRTVADAFLQAGISVDDLLENIDDLAAEGLTLETAFPDFAKIFDPADFRAFTNFLSDVATQISLVNGLEADRLQLLDRLRTVGNELIAQAASRVAADARADDVELRAALRERKQALKDAALNFAASQGVAATALASLVSQIGQLRESTRQEREELEREIIRLSRLSEGLRGRIGDLLLEQAAEGPNSERDRLIGSLREQLTILEQVAELRKEERLNLLATALLQEAVLQKERKRALILAGGGSAAQAAVVGLEKFAEGLPTLNESVAETVAIGAQAGIDAISGAMQALFEEDLEQGLRQVGVAFLNTLSSAIFDALATQIVSFFLSGVLNLQTGATIAAATLEAGGVAAGLAMVAAAEVAAGILGISAAVSPVPAVIGPAEGGRVPYLEGFARGGRKNPRVHPSGPRFSRPVPGLDNRDRYLGALRADEYVIRPEAARRVGYSFLDSLNAMRVNPAAAAAIAGPAPVSSPTVVQGLVGAAGGGSFAPRSLIPPALPSGSGQQASQGPVRAILTQRELERGLTGRDRMFQKLLAEARGSQRPSLNQ